MKKIIWHLCNSMCLIIIFSVIYISTAFAVSNGSFADVSEGQWFYPSVQYVVEHQMMSGTGENRFSPDAATTRGMIVTVLHRMEGTPAAAAAKFDDVEPAQYYAEAVSWAAEHGIVTGYGDGKFGPNDPITREQMAAILYRYAQFKEYDMMASGDLLTFNDADAVHDYGVDPMSWAVGSNLISGMGDGMLCPQGRATRAQIAAILMRFRETVVLKNVLPEETVPEVPEDQEEVLPENNSKPLTAPTIVLDTVEAEAGQKDVAITVCIKKNPGIISLALITSYDQDLTLKSIEYHEEAGGQTMLPQTIKNPVKLLWINPLEDVTKDFVLATLHFDISEQAEAGYHQISVGYNPDDIYNLADKNVAFDTINGAIVIKK